MLNIKDLENLAEKGEYQKVLNKLKRYLKDDKDDIEVNGIGTVYLVTLMYFISKGKCPIYDRFAKMAITAINDKKMKLGESVPCKELPNRVQEKLFERVVEDDLQEYWNAIYAIFGKDEYLNNRDIDRALWVYGHLFYKK